MPCMVNSWSYCSGVSRCRFDQDSCSRKTSASTPPSDQEGEGGDDVADADFLVIHRRQPAIQARRGFPQSRAAAPPVPGLGGGGRMALIIGVCHAVQCLQIGVDIAAARHRTAARRRHQAAGLERLADRRSSAPAWRPSLGSTPEAMVLPLHQVAKVRAQRAFAHRCRAPHGSCRNGPRTAWPSAIACAPARQLMIPPGAGIAPACSAITTQRHLGMLHAAIFGALAAIDAGRRGLDPGLVGLAGNGVHLAGQLRHPEGMDHIAADQLQPHRRADRECESRWRW